MLLSFFKELCKVMCFVCRARDEKANPKTNYLLLLAKCIIFKEIVC